MAISVGIAPTTVESKIDTGAWHRRIALVCAALLTAVAIGVSLRLMAVVAATPTSEWTIQRPRVLPGIQTQPIWVASSTLSLVAPGEVGRAALAECLTHNQMEPSGQSLSACALHVERLLEGAPASGELWYLRALLLSNQGHFGSDLFDSLRATYAFSGAEGWLATDRVVFGLRIYPLLPPDLQAAVARDFTIVLQRPALSSPLVHAFANDAAIRNGAAAVLPKLSERDTDVFLDRVREYLANAGD